MFATKKHPYQALTLLLISFIAGILIAKYMNLQWQAIWPDFVLIIIGLLLITLINLVLDNKVLVLMGWIAIFFATGLMVYSYQSHKYFCTADLSGKNVEIAGTVINNPLVDYKSQEIIIKSNLGECQNIRLLAKIPHYPALRYGDEIKLTADIQKPGMIEDFDYARYLKPKGVSYLALNSLDVIATGNKRNIAMKFIAGLYDIKNRFESAINRTMAEPEASLGIGIITGSKRNIPEELTNNLNAAGLTHIIALSGYNVTIIVAALTSLLISVFNRKKIFWIGSFIVIIFIIMTGASASVVRAGIFSLLVLFAKTIGRKSYQTNLLLLAAALMLVFNPFLLADDLGFQLSFLAFAGIIYLGQFVQFMMENSFVKLLPDWLRKILRETLSAQIMVFPLIAFAFGRISIISPISNVLSLWILPVSMLLSFMAGVGGIIWYYLGRTLSILAWPVLAYIISVANISAKAPFSSLNTGKDNYLLILGLYLLIFLVVIALQKRIKRWQKDLQKSF